MVYAKKLPSGNWRARVQTEVINRKQMYEPFIAETEDEANYLALEFELKYKNKSKPMNLTVGEAIDKYITARDAILSPSTVREYKQERKNYLQSIMNIKLKDLTNEHVQKAINEDKKTRSAKTVRNAHCLLSSVLKAYYPNFQLTTALPQKEKTEMIMPDESNLTKILNACKGKSVEIPIILAVSLGLRRSEICGLKWDNIDFDNNTITIKNTIVMGEHGNVEKPNPKSYAGNRTLKMPTLLREKLEAIKPPVLDDSKIIKINGQRIYKNFIKILGSLGLPHMRFHDLRHFNASVMLSLNVPNKYAAKRMGHSTEDMLKKVYQHLSERKTDEITETINSYFDNLCNNENGSNVTKNVTDK